MKHDDKIVGNTILSNISLPESILPKGYSNRDICWSNKDEEEDEEKY